MVAKVFPVIPVPARCWHCNTPNIHRVKNRIGSGAYQVWDMCLSCGKNAWGKVYYIPHKQAGLPLEDIPLFQDYTHTNPPCIVCRKTGTELHHFAPKHIFGAEEAERWPQAYLCKEHHDQWHQLIALHYQDVNCLYCKGLITKAKENGYG